MAGIEYRSDYKNGQRYYLSTVILIGWGYLTGSFLTLPAEKTKTQEQTSRKKLKEEKSIVGRTFPHAKLKKTTEITELFSSKLSFPKGALFIHTINKYFQKQRKKCKDILKIVRFCGEKWKISPKTQ